jgi:hypothetical protein
MSVTCSQKGLVGQGPSYVDDTAMVVTTAACSACRTFMFSKNLLVCVTPSHPHHHACDEEYRHFHPPADHNGWDPMLLFLWW